MAKELLILVRSGDEFRLAAPLLFGRETADVEVLHIDAAIAGVSPRADDQFISEPLWEEIVALLEATDLAHFERVIIPSIYGPAPGAILCAAVATLGLGNLWMMSDGLHDEIHEVDRSRLPALMTAVNEALARDGPFTTDRARTFAGLVGLRKVASEDIVNYAAYLGLPNCPRYEWLYAAVDEASDPWGLGTSAHERRRHDIELSLLDEIGWMTLVEVGACTGLFTKRVAAAFRERHMIAVENDILFLPRLRAMAGPTVSVFEGSIFDFHVRADLFVLANCIYDMDCFPAHVLDLAQRGILTSHRPDFERNVVEAAFGKHGWRKLASREVPPVAESYCGELIVRDGSLANLWAAPRRRPEVAGQPVWHFHPRA